MSPTDALAVALCVVIFAVLILARRIQLLERRSEPLAKMVDPRERLIEKISTEPGGYHHAPPPPYRSYSVDHSGAIVYCDGERLEPDKTKIDPPAMRMLER